MLLSKEIITKWNSKTKKYYESLGYQFTKMGDSFMVSTCDLKPSSKEKVLIKCDYCYKEYLVTWSDRSKNLKNTEDQLDACNNCKTLKARDTVKNKYGVENIMEIEGVEEKRTSTIKEKYGVDNVFQSEEIKENIKKTMFIKYGNEVFTRTSCYDEKRKKTSLIKYGEDSHMKTKKYKDLFSGVNSPNWKGGVHDIRWDRLQPIYKKWRNSVFSRDTYICKKCNIKEDYIEAHHIFNWKDNPEKRYDISNGITLCRKCHSLFHSIYGKKNNNENQITEFISQT